MSWESYINYTLCELSNISKKLTPRWDLFGESSYSNLIWESPWRVVFAPSGTNRWQEILGAPSYWKIFTFLGFTMVRFYQFILNIVFLCPQLQHWPFLDVFFLPCETPRHCFGGGCFGRGLYQEYPQQSTHGIASTFVDDLSWFSWNHLNNQSIL